MKEIKKLFLNEYYTYINIKKQLKKLTEERNNLLSHLVKNNEIKPIEKIYGNDSIVSIEKNEDTIILYIEYSARSCVNDYTLKIPIFILDNINEIYNSLFTSNTSNLKRKKWYRVLKRIYKEE